MKNKKTIKIPRLLCVQLLALMLGCWGISADTQVLQAAQTKKEIKQELPTGGVDEIKVYRVDAAAAEHVPSYENQLSFFSRRTSVFEAGTGDYGYNSLADNQKSLYMSLEISLRNFENLEDAEFTEVWGSYVPFKVSCDVTEISDEEIIQVVTAFEADHPGLFWMRNLLISSVVSGGVVSECYIMPVVSYEYRNNVADVKEMYAKIEDGVASYLDAVAGTDDTYEKVRIVYDKLISEVEYAYDSSHKPEDAHWAHSIVGVFDGTHKSVVCEGYAKTFSFLMNILDIPNVYISGIVESTSDNPRHAWNAVSFDGGNTYYYVDATWDDKGEKNEPQNLYEYFAMPKSEFEESHMAHTPLEGGHEWLYELPTLGDDMDFTYYARYAALATKDMVREPESAKEFLMAASALAPGEFCMVLVPGDFRTRRNMEDALGGISIGSSSWSYGTMDVELYVIPAENYLPTVPAKTFSLSDLAVTIDMDETTTQEIKVCSVTEDSDDYIRCYSSNEKVATVEKACIRAKNGESIHIVAKGEGTAVIYAKSAKGGATVACTVSVKPASVPIPTATPTPVSSPSRYGLASPRMDSDRVTTWDCVYFGNYWQNDTNGDGVADEKDEKEPVKWRVLSVDEDEVFLMADQTLDEQPYHNIGGKVTWETSALRAWLNGTFLSTVFSEDEQSAIQTTRVVNNDGYRTDDEKDTDDKLYLLSLDEVMDTSYGFITSRRSTAARESLYTQYAEWNCQNTDSNGRVINNWWLRSMGEGYGSQKNGYTSLVEENGVVDWYGRASFANKGVRPVLHLNLSSTSVWSLAGTVSSDGTVTTPNTQPTPTIVPTLNPATSPAVSPTPTAAATGAPSLNIAEPRTDQDGVTTWDCVYFGNYWQSDTDGDGKADKNDSKEPIKWRVLAVDGDDVFLLADQNLDVQTYSGDSWEGSGVRLWLNEYFFQNAFATYEKSAIKNTTVVNEGNQKYYIKGGKDTEDKVYLLSISEATNASYGFVSKMGKTNTRKSANTGYVANGGSIGSKYMKNAGDCDWWWLRSPGFSCRMAADVDENGCVYQKGMNVGVRNRAVRPALHLDLSSAGICSPAGTVSSDGTVIEPAPTPTIKPSATPAATMAPDITPSATPVGTATPVITAMPDITPSATPIVNPTAAPTPVASVVPTQVPPAQTFIPLPTVVPTVTPTQVPPAQTFIPLPIVAPTVTPAAAPSNPPFQKSLANPEVNSDGVTTWDCVYFGHYRQSDTNKDGIIDERDKEEPIKWRILSVNGDDAFILSDKSLDAQEYDVSGDDNITWETSTLRSWLNSTFYKKAFSAEEQNVINDVLVENKNNPEYGTSGGNNTRDNVFLLSLEELTNVAFGFSPDFQNPSNTRIAKDTDYTKTRVMYVGEEDSGGFWWLRTPGCSSEHAIDVSYDGSADLLGGLVWKVPNAVRPALHLNLKALPDTISDPCWSYAGTVSSDGTENEVAQPSPVPTVTSAPVVSPSIIPTATPAVNPTEEPEVTPAASLKPTEKPTGQPQATTDPGPIQSPSQVTGSSVQIPTASAAVTKRQQDEDDDMDEDDEDEELKKGSYFMSGNFGYKITKLKKKKGEIAVVCVKSKNSKAYVIPNKVRKQGITFTVTSIQANAFKGCKKAKSLNIKAVAIKAIGKKALNDLNKKIRIKVPKKKFWIYRKMLRKCGYWTVR